MRDLKQVQNVKMREVEKQRLSRDEIFNTLLFSETAKIGEDPFIIQLEISRLRIGMAVGPMASPFSGLKTNAHFILRK